MPITKKQKVAGGLTAGALALAAVFIPHWESGGRMDTTVRQQSFDPRGVYTVCDGITNLDPDYAWIRPGMKFTEAQCAEAFKKVLPKYIEPLGDCVIGYYQMPPHRQVALLSAGYNLGTGTVCRSTAVRLLNQGKIDEGCEALGAFVRANGKVLKGLQNRRFDPKWGEIAWCKRKD
jgi:lysozyme